MNRQPNSNQRGVALLIAIFSLLLISGAAVAMIMMAGIAILVLCSHLNGPICPKLIVSIILLISP